MRILTALLLFCVSLLAMGETSMAAGWSAQIEGQEVVLQKRFR